MSRIGLSELELLADPATEHRPRDRASQRAAAVDLTARGLSVQDAARALGVSELALRELLKLPTEIEIESAYQAGLRAALIDKRERDA